VCTDVFMCAGFGLFNKQLIATRYPDMLNCCPVRAYPSLQVMQARLQQLALGLQQYPERSSRARRNQQQLSRCATGLCQVPQQQHHSSCAPSRACDGVAAAPAAGQQRAVSRAAGSRPGAADAEPCAAASNRLVVGADRHNTAHTGPSRHTRGAARQPAASASSGSRPKPSSSCGCLAAATRACSNTAAAGTGGCWRGCRRCARSW
jgi:hypothetical protein